MGLKTFSDCNYSKVTSSTDTSPNPNPFRFEIREGFDYDKCCVLVVYYPDCTTFEGMKVLVTDGCVADYKVAKSLDPHFFEKGDVIARFKPTKEGIEQAKSFAKNL
jgi:hypothetical protein